MTPAELRQRKLPQDEEARLLEPDKVHDQDASSIARVSNVVVGLSHTAWAGVYNDIMEGWSIRSILNLTRCCPPRQDAN